jgi:large repetitive protein
LIPPQIVPTETISLPNYQQLVNEAIPAATPVVLDLSKTQLKTLGQWQSNFPVGGTVNNPKVVKVTNGNLEVPDRVNLSNYVIIVDRGGINFKGTQHNLENVVLVAQAGKIG